MLPKIGISFILSLDFFSNSSKACFLISAPFSLNIEPFVASPASSEYFFISLAAFFISSVATGSIVTPNVIIINGLANNQAVTAKPAIMGPHSFIISPHFLKSSLLSFTHFRNFSSFSCVFLRASLTSFKNNARSLLGFLFGPSPISLFFSSPNPNIALITSSITFANSFSTPLAFSITFCHCAAASLSFSKAFLNLFMASYIIMNTAAKAIIFKIIGPLKAFATVPICFAIKAKIDFPTINDATIANI